MNFNTLLEPNITDKSRNKCRSNCFHRCPLVTSILILLPFLTVRSTTIRYQEIVNWIPDEYCVYIVVLFVFTYPSWGLEKIKVSKFKIFSDCI